jgi:type I restriction enzyme S subunit
MSEALPELTVQQLVDQGIIERPIDGNHGERHPKTSDFVSSGVPFIMASDLWGGRVNTSTCSFISEEMAASLRKGFARAGDVLLSHKATIGRTAVVEDDPRFPVLVLTPQVTYYRVRDPKRLDNRYLKFYFDSPDFQDLFALWAGAGSTRAYLGITAQAHLPIVVPSIDTQRAIARILGALDDKIELNRRMNFTLETVAQKLFTSWFVDFEPVVARSEGRNHFGLPDELAALFPSDFEDSEQGSVPRGWRPASLSEAIELVRELVDPQAAGFEEFDHHSIPAFDSGQRPMREIGSAIKSGKYLVPDDAILLSKLNPETPRVWWPTPDPQRRSIASTEFLVCRARKGVTRTWLYWQLRDADFLDEFATRVTGTSNSHQRVRPDDLLRLVRIDPGQALRDRFAGLVEASTKRMVANLAQSQKLAALRDLLLPKLLSGELRVPVAERAIAAAL